MKTAPFTIARINSILDSLETHPQFQRIQSLVHMIIYPHESNALESHPRPFQPVLSALASSINAPSCSTCHSSETRPLVSFVLCSPAAPTIFPHRNSCRILCTAAARCISALNPCTHTRNQRRPRAARVLPHSSYIFPSTHLPAADWNNWNCPSHMRLTHPPRSSPRAFMIPSSAFMSFISPL